MFGLIKKLWSDESGQGLPEYALLVGFVVVLVIAIAALWSDQVKLLVADVGSRLDIDAATTE
jgi:Flp pilus assembly pilin Flp